MAARTQLEAHLRSEGHVHLANMHAYNGRVLDLFNHHGSKVRLDSHKLEARVVGCALAHTNTIAKLANLADTSANTMKQTSLTLEKIGGDTVTGTVDLGTSGGAVVVDGVSDALTRGTAAVDEVVSL